MKKTMAILLAVTILFGVFTCCGTGESGFTSSAASDHSETNVPVQMHASEEAQGEASTSMQQEEPDVPSYSLPISEEPLTYSLWTTYAPFAADLVNTDTLEGLMVLDTVQEITNIHFDVTTANGAAEQDNFNLMIAVGDYCDIMSALEYYQTGFEGLVDDGILQDLADILPEKFPTYWSYLSANTNTLMRAYTDSGYMPCICCLSPELGQEAIGLVLRKDWLDDFGMDMPTTYDALFSYLEAAKTEKNAAYILSTTDGLVGDLAAGLNISISGNNSGTNSGFEVVDGVVEYGMAQSAFQDYLKFMNRLYENEIISQDFFAETSEDLSSTARLGFGTGTNSLVGTSAANTADIVMGVTEDTFEMAVMPYVSLDGNSGNHVGPETLADNLRDNDTWGFSTECKDIEPLLEMVEFLFSDEGYILSNYGIEGETYTLDENGQPQYTDLVTNNPDGLSYFFASYVYATNAASSFFPYMNDLSRSFYEFTDNQWEVYDDLKNLSDCAYNSPAYATLSTVEAVSYASIASELKTYTSSIVLEFIIGTRDIDSEFENFVAQMYEMGLQEMIDLKQATYDRAMERCAPLGA